MAGVVARFVTTSALWLDEALSVNIARLPVPELLDALERDGHPPLYYLLLHVWMDVFGADDVAVRALSGIFSVAVLPLVWIAARRRGGGEAGLLAVVLLSLTPFAIRYGSEARMYSLLALLAMAAWLVADDLDRLGGRWRWFGLAALTGLGLLTHYWVIYMGLAAVALLGCRFWIDRDRRRFARTASALAAGCLLFLPWIPSFVHQLRHTGTPWATAARPAQALVELAHGLGGSYLAESLLFGLVLLGLAALAVLVARTSGPEVVLDVRSVPTVRGEMAFVTLTLGIGVVVGLLTQGAFVARYTAGLVPLIVVAAAVGITRLPGGVPRAVVFGSTVLLALPGAYRSIVDSRTQGQEIAEAIAAQGSPDDIVVVCPDQLGPSLLRSLPAQVEVVGVPALERPDRIDWVDYGERNEAADGGAVARSVLDDADGRTIWLVYNGGYRTYEDLCPAVLASLSAERVATSVVSEDERAFERATLYRFEP